MVRGVTRLPQGRRVVEEEVTKPRMSRTLEETKMKIALIAGFITALGGFGWFVTAGDRADRMAVTSACGVKGERCLAPHVSMTIHEAFAYTATR